MKLLYRHPFFFRAYTGSVRSPKPWIVTPKSRRQGSAKHVDHTPPGKVRVTYLHSRGDLADSSTLAVGFRDWGRAEHEQQMDAE